MIKNHRNFCNEILKNSFKSNNYSSFVRQLNLYNFHKKNDKNSEEFENEYFQKDNPELLFNIQRQNKPKLKIKCNELENRISLLKFPENIQYNSINKKMFDSLKVKMIDASNESIKVKNGIKELEKKIEFLSCCKTNLNKRMNLIKNELIKQNQRSKELEKIFISTLQEILPNLKIKSYFLLDNEDEKINRINHLFTNINDYIKSHNDNTKDNIQICKNQYNLYDNFNYINELNYIDKIKDLNNNIFYKDNKIKNIIMLDDENDYYNNFDSKISPINNNFSFSEKNYDKEFYLPSPTQVNFSFHSLEDNYLGKKKNAKEENFL